MKAWVIAASLAAALSLAPAAAQGLEGIAPGDEVIVLTWLHRAQRDVLQVHPRGNPDAPLRGVFATRSPDRPNPIGLPASTSWRSPGTAFASRPWRR